MLGAKLLLADRQRALEQRPRLRIYAAPMKITARPVQKVGAFSVCGGVIHFRLAAHAEMRRKFRATRPRTGVVIAVAWIDRRKPRNQTLDRALRRIFIRGPRPADGLNEAMHGHRRLAILERVMLDE